MSPVVSLPMDSVLLEQLDLLVQVTAHDRAYHVHQALVQYIEHQNWQIGSIQEGLEDARAGNFVELTDIENKWGNRER